MRAAPEPVRLALGLLVSFACVLTLAVLWGAALVDATLPWVGDLILCLDERFAILFLGIDHTVQDTVVRLRVNLTRIVVVGGHPEFPHPRGWLEVTTTVGAMLQPLSLALGLAGGWPGQLRERALAVLFAALAAGTFLLADLPITLHAYVWDMFVDHYEPDRFSPILIWHDAMHDGGRLGVGVLLGTLAIVAARRLSHRTTARNMPSGGRSSSQA